MGERTGVDHDAGRSTPRRVDDIDEVSLVVGLMVLDGQAERLGGHCGSADVVVERRRPVHLGLTLTQQVQVRPRQQQDAASG